MVDRIHLYTVVDGATMTRRTLETGADCPIEVTLDIIGGKWKGMVLHRLLAMSDWGERYLE